MAPALLMRLRIGFDRAGTGAGTGGSVFQPILPRSPPCSTRLPIAGVRRRL